MRFVKFLRFLRIKLIKRRRVADRVAAVDLGEDDGEASIIVCKQIPRGTPTVFSWEEIQKLTMKFSKVIGYGGFSTVYLARLPGSSSAAAVKIQCSSERLDLAHKQELDILARLRHDNIVKLIGHCNDTEEGVLVMEYVPNGTLQEALHSSKKILSWKKRMAIAFQLAQAMEYLHGLQIIHGDIKSSNVLLDDDLDCKLCDFGSAKMGFSATIAPPSSRNRARAVMVGSPGYTDPHYLRTGLASKKNDIYSFGVIVLELITGMEAVDPASGQRLTARLQPMLRDADKVAGMVDPLVRGGFELEEAKAMAIVAATCLADTPALRPCATEIRADVSSGIPSLSCSKKKLNKCEEFFGIIGCGA